jgi:hypothetical protein
MIAIKIVMHRIAGSAGAMTTAVPTDTMIADTMIVRTGAAGVRMTAGEREKAGAMTTGAAQGLTGAMVRDGGKDLAAME